jgi:hypothetical protein
VAQASPGAVERSLGRSPPQVDAMQPGTSATQPVIEVPDDSQIPKVGWLYMLFHSFTHECFRNQGVTFFCKVHKLKHKVV